MLCILHKNGHALRRGRLGTTAVQVAVIFPVFFFFILSLVEVGRGLMVLSLMDNAARAGCRAGVIPGAQNSTVTTVINHLLSSQGITAQSTTIKVNGTVADISTAGSGDQIQVKVSVPVSSVTWVPVPRFLSGNLTGVYSLRHE
jgi:Flp pilus assembly protein TadG